MLISQIFYSVPLQSSSSLYYPLGVNPKVKQSVQTMFSLAHDYGNILREGWKDLLDCLLALFKAKLLPQQMVEVGVVRVCVHACLCVDMYQIICTGQN